MLPNIQAKTNPAAPDEIRLMLLGSPSDMIHGTSPHG
jgi:hypothetical protein